MYSLSTAFFSTLTGAAAPAPNTSDAPQTQSSNSGAATKRGKKKTNKKKKKKSAALHSSAEAAADEEEASLQSDDEDVPVESITAPAATSTEKEVDNSIAAMVFYFENNQIEDPIELMIQRIVQEDKARSGGQSALTVDVVREVVNRMFEQGKKYDEYHAVKKELSSLLGKPAKHDRAPPQPVKDVAKEASPLTEEPATVKAQEVKPRAAPKTVATTETVTSQQSSSTPAVAPPPTQSMSTIDRLNYVADFANSNLYDALAALCSWASVSVSAPGQQHDTQSDDKVREFFESQVLEKLLTIFFSDASLPLSTRGEVKGALQTLLHHILQLQSDQYGTGYIYYLTEALEELVKEIQQMRRSVVALPGLQLEADPSDDTTPMGYKLLARQVAQCLKQLYFQTQDAAVASKKAISDVIVAGSSSSGMVMNSIDAKIDALDKQLAGIYEEAANEAKKKPSRGATDAITINNDEDVAARAAMKRLFATRELLHDRFQLLLEKSKPGGTAADGADTSTGKVSAAAEAAATINPLNGAWQSGVTQSINTSTGQLENELFKHQKDNMPTVAQSRSHKHSSGNILSAISSSAGGSGGLGLATADDLNQSLQMLQRERDQQTSALQQEVRSCTSRQQDLMRHKESLQQQLKLCEQELNVNSERITEAEKKLALTDTDFQQRAQQLIEKSESLQKDQQVQKQVTLLLDGVRNLEYKFADALFCRQQHLQNELQQHLQEIKLKQTAGDSRTSAPAKGNSNTTVITATPSGMKVQREDGSSAALLEEHQSVGMALKSYIETESQCISSLTGRVQAAQGKLVALQKELQAYRAVAMKGQVVLTTEASIEKLTEEVQEDTSAVQFLQAALAQCIKLTADLFRQASPSIDIRKYVPNGALYAVVTSCKKINITAEQVFYNYMPPTAASSPAPSGGKKTPSKATAPSANNVSIKNEAPAVRSEVSNDAGPSKTNRNDEKVNGSKPSKASDHSSKRNSRSDGKEKASKKSTIDTTNAIMALEKRTASKPAAQVADDEQQEKTASKLKQAPVVAPVANVWQAKAQPNASETASSASTSGAFSRSGTVGKSLREIQLEQMEAKKKGVVQKSQEATPVVSAVDENDIATSSCVTPNKDTDASEKEQPVSADSNSSGGSSSCEQKNFSRTPMVDFSTAYPQQQLSEEEALNHPYETINTLPPAAPETRNDDAVEEPATQSNSGDAEEKQDADSVAPAGKESVVAADIAAAASDVEEA